MLTRLSGIFTHSEMRKGDLVTIVFDSATEIYRLGEYHILENYWDVTLIESILYGIK